MPRDQAYIIGIWDELLRQVSSKEHTFDFLRGDSGRKLPVDAYYAELNLVIEYRERQHTESVPFWDKKATVSGVPRGVQRQIYDQRRRDILPLHGVFLVELNVAEFEHDNRKRLIRNLNADVAVLRKRLSRWL